MFRVLVFSVQLDSGLYHAITISLRPSTASVRHSLLHDRNLANIRTPIIRRMMSPPTTTSIHGITVAVANRCLADDGS